MFDIVEAVKDFGATYITIYMPMRRLVYAGIITDFAFRDTNSSEDIISCTITENRYAVEDAYKITIKADDPMYGKEDFYISDFNSMINSADSKITITTTQCIGDDYEVVTLHLPPEINNTPPTFLGIFKEIFEIN